MIIVHDITANAIKSKILFLFDDSQDVYQGAQFCQRISKENEKIIFAVKLDLYYR